MPRRTIVAPLVVLTAAALTCSAVRAQTESRGDQSAETKGRTRGGTPGFGGPGGPPGGFGLGTFLAPQVLDLADADKDGRLTPKEAGEAAERLLREADTDKKGALDDGALARAINQKLGPPPGGPGGPPGGPGGPPSGGPGGPGGFGPGGLLARQIVRAADANQDGRLAPEEAREAAERLVREVDEENKGSIGVEALAQALNRRISPPEGFGGPGGPGGFGRLSARAPQILAYADANQDGRLSVEEARRAAARFVREADTEKEGSLAFEPLLKALGGGTGPMRGPGNPEYPARGHGPGDMQAMQVMELADADHDDHLSPEEAADAAERLVRAADTDKKGSIDLDGLRNALGRVMGSPFGPGGPGGPPGGFGGPPRADR
jgi:Ca2+-binding EF-hand superfamily protein